MVFTAKYYMSKELLQVCNQEVWNGDLHPTKLRPTIA